MREPSIASRPSAERIARLVGLAIVAAAVTATVATPAIPAFAADAEAGRGKAEPCGRCHGPDGNATVPGTPSLAGQPTLFTHWQLIKFRDGRRTNAQMSPPAAGLTDTDMADLAAYYALQRPTPRAAPTDSANAAVGQRLAEVHHCVSCHKPGFSGQQQVPRLAGQDVTYLVKILRAFKAQTAGDLDGTMTMVVQPLTDVDIDNLAHYIAGLTPTP